MEKGKAFNKKLASLLKQYPDAEIVVLVNNDEISDPTMFEFTKHSIKAVEYKAIVETEDGRIYTSIEPYKIDQGNSETEEGESEKYVVYPAIVITTEASL
jgi:hypothetical protein